MIPANFNVHIPSSIAETINLLSKFGPDAKILAGGQSLIPMMKLRLVQTAEIIDLSNITELIEFKKSQNSITLGAMTTYHDLITNDELKLMHPMVVESASVVADIQVRNRGTVGGSLAHADPAADLPAAMIASNAVFNIASPNGNKKIKAADFFVDIFTTLLEENEILTSIEIPNNASGDSSSETYKKFANKASHFAIVGVAARVNVTNKVCSDVSIAITGAGAKPVKAKKSEAILTGTKMENSDIATAANESINELDFLDDIHASSAYREHLTKTFVSRALSEISAGISI
jgi:carbon-monoxide dehydrogenase medium subunit